MKYKRLVIFFSGKQGSGKSTACRIAKELLESEEIGPYPVYHLRFAARVYELADIIEAYLAPLAGREPMEKNGPLLQVVGNEVGRKLYGESVWVDALYRDLTDGFPYTKDTPSVFLIEDTRMENELALHKKLQDEGFLTLTVRLEAPEEVRKPRTKSWRENTQHISEIGLDHLVGEFDIVIDTTHGLDDMKTKLARAITPLLGTLVSGEKKQATDNLDRLVEQFNAQYQDWSQANSKSANFEFKYVQDPDGTFRKRLVAWDIVDMTTTPPADVEAIGAEVQKVMENLDGPIGV